MTYKVGTHLKIKDGEVQPQAREIFWAVVTLTGFYCGLYVVLHLF